MYETLHKINTSFSPSVPGLQIAWDSTSLGLLKRCPRLYQYSMLDGWISKDAAIPLHFGILYHKGLERYDRLRADGADLDEALREAIRHVLVDSGQRDASGKWIPWKPDDTYRNIPNLIRAIVWYVDSHQEDRVSTIQLSNGRAAVELSFKLAIPLENPDGGTYVLCGHMDRLVQFGESIYVLDYKTTKLTPNSYYFEKYNPDNQMSLYTLAANVVLQEPAAGIILDVAQLQVGGTKFERGIVSRTKGQIDEWLSDTIVWIKKAEHHAEKGHWEMNDTSCDKYGGCPFRHVCASDPKVRETYLKSDFIKRVWDPLVERGD